MQFKSILNFFSKKEEPLNIDKLYESIDIANTSLKPKNALNATALNNFEWVYEKPEQYNGHYKSILSNVLFTSQSIYDITLNLNYNGSSEYKEKLEMIRIINNYEDKQTIPNGDIQWTVDTLKNNKDKRDNFLEKKDEFNTIHDKSEQLIKAIQYITSTNVMTKDEKTNLNQHISRLENINKDFKAACINQSEFIKYQESLEDKVSLFTSSRSLNINSVKNVLSKLDNIQNNNTVTDNKSPKPN